MLILVYFIELGCCYAYFASPELISCPTAVVMRAHVEEVETGRTEHYLQKSRKHQAEKH